MKKRLYKVFLQCEKEPVLVACKDEEDFIYYFTRLDDKVESYEYLYEVTVVPDNRL